jgi:hypothetical protein
LGPVSLVGVMKKAESYKALWHCAGLYIYNSQDLNSDTFLTAFELFSELGEITRV